MSEPLDVFLSRFCSSPLDPEAFEANILVLEKMVANILAQRRSQNQIEATAITVLEKILEILERHMNETLQKTQENQELQDYFLRCFCVLEPMQEVLRDEKTKLLQNLGALHVRQKGVQAYSLHAVYDDKDSMRARRDLTLDPMPMPFKGAL